LNAYQTAIHEEMLEFAKDPRVIFLGQQVNPESFYGTLDGIELSRRMEMPVAEELQMGMSIGMAMNGFLPISIYQRMDFLPRAADQIINHLEVMRDMTDGKFDPKVIIRTTVGSHSPLNVGIQHNKDLTDGFVALLKNIDVIKVRTPFEVHEAYGFCRKYDQSFLIIEEQDLYGD